ncbi:MAG: sugar phosphate nucleotidyltransferase [Candidatus Hydrogenedentota bacterium]
MLSGILVVIKYKRMEELMLQQDQSRFEQDIIGVALAAGKGSRMMNLPSKLPKPVLPVLDKPIVYHQLEAMAALGISKAIIVVGHRGYEVVRQIERQPPVGIEIDYVPQEVSLGIAHCVGCLESALDRPFLLFLGDIYFHAPKLEGIIKTFRETKADAVLGAIEEEDPKAISRNYCIVTDENGLARQVIEKPRYPKSNLKGVGIYLFTPVVFDAIRRTSRTAMRDEYEITESIQILIDLGYDVRCCTDIIHDLNVTFPRDLLDLNLWALEHEGLEKYVAETAQIGSGAVLEKSVVGAGAIIGAGAVVRKSVIFPGGRVPGDCVLENVIVTESEVCRV